MRFNKAKSLPFFTCFIHDVHRCGYKKCRSKATFLKMKHTIQSNSVIIAPKN